MDHERARELIDRFSDDMLTDSERAELEQHAQSCEECGRALRIARILKETFAGAARTIEPPGEAELAWKDAIRAEARRQKKTRLVRWASALAAAFLAVAGSSVLLLNRPGRQADEKAITYVAIDGSEYSEEAAFSGSEAEECAEIPVCDAVPTAAECPEEGYGTFFISASEELTKAAELYAAGTMQDRDGTVYLFDREGYSSFTDGITEEALPEFPEGEDMIRIRFVGPQ